MPERTSPHSLFPPVEVAPAPTTHSYHTSDRHDFELIRLLRDLVSAQDRQNELLEELVQQMGANQRQRNQELQQWKSANPELAQKCRVAAEALCQVQTSFLQNLTEEAAVNADALNDGEYMLGEFVDRYGPRLAHLNGILQVLAQLGGQANEPRA